ncbi:MAG: hypothetical protein ACLPH3_13475 [Terracidiphilus sp.]
MRELLWVGLRGAAGLCSIFVSVRGFDGMYGIDFRIDTLISILYCVFPVASFFIFIFVKPPKLEVSLHALIAIGYLTTFSILNWRTCAELGYCESVATTVLGTLRTWPVAAGFGVVVFCLAAHFLGRRPRNRPTILSLSEDKSVDHASSK